MDLCGYSYSTEGLGDIWKNTENFDIHQNFIKNTIKQTKMSTEIDVCKHSTSWHI